MTKNTEDNRAADAFLNEVEDDIRQQQLKEFWMENRSWIIGGAVLAVIMTAGLTTWRHYEARRNTATTAALLTTVAQKDPAALTDFASAQGGDHGVIARLEAAAMYLEEGDTQKAVAVYDSIAATRGVERLYRDLGALLSVAQQIDSAEPKDLYPRLEKLSDNKSPWRYSALEMQALLHAREGRMMDATRVLTEITTDARAPENLRRRAYTMREVYLGNAQ